jgi:hypothetical protein
MRLADGPGSREGDLQAGLRTPEIGQRSYNHHVTCEPPPFADRSGEANYWTVTTMAMTEAEATGAANLIRDAYPEVYADPVNPRQFMTLFLDRWTAQALRDAIAMFTKSGADAGNMLEDFDDWLAIAEPEGS